LLASDPATRKTRAEEGEKKNARSYDRRVVTILPDGQITHFLSSPFCKNILVFVRPKSPAYSPPSRLTQRGVSRSSRTLVRDAVDAGGACDERRRRGRPNRVVLTPRRRRQALRKMTPQATVTRKPDRRGDHVYAVKTTAWGMPGCYGDLAVNTRVHTTTTKRTRGCGCAWHPAFPTPSDWRGRRILAWLGRFASRGCGGVSVVIAKRSAV
jgi:hypothetical protein